MAPQLSINQKISLIESKASGLADTQNAKFIGCTRFTVRNVINNWNQTKSVERKKYNSSNRSKLSDQQRMNIITCMELNKGISLKKIISICELPIQPPALCKILKKDNYRLYSNKLKLNLTDEMKDERFVWGSARKDFGVNYWRSIAYSDESTFKSHSDNYRPRSYQPKGKNVNFSFNNGNLNYSVSLKNLSCGLF